MDRVLIAALTCLVSSECCFAWLYHGCYQDKGMRHLETMVASDENMTIQKCIQLCSYRGNFYAGVQYASRCFCGNYIKPEYTKFADYECSTPCTGDASQKCGGTWKVSIYSTYKYEGCYVDAWSRILEGPTKVSASMTTDMCIDYCRNAKKAFALTQYSTECLCGNSLKPYVKKPDTECNYGCNGARTEKCGGFWRGSLYRV